MSAFRDYKPTLLWDLPALSPCYFCLSLDEWKNGYVARNPITIAHICTIVKIWLSKGSQIWPQCDVTRRQTDEGSRIVYITEKAAHHHAQNVIFGLFKPGCLGWLAGFISTCFYSSKVSALDDSDICVFQEEAMRLEKTMKQVEEGELLVEK